MEQWFSNGQIVDVILALLALEILGFILLKRRMRMGSFVGEIVATLLSGLCLLFALRGALVEAAWPYIATGLLASLFFHILTLKMFWKRSSKRACLEMNTSKVKTATKVLKIEK